MIGAGMAESGRTSHMDTRLSRAAGYAALAGITLLGLHARAAWAAAYQLHENSAVSIGTAFAGAGSAADTPATAFNNPAGLTELEGLQFDGGGSLIAPSFTFHGSATNEFFGTPVSGNNNANGGHAAFVPYGYMSWRINDRFAVGLALTSPFGLSTYYGPDFVGRYSADKTLLTTIDINPNIAYKVNDWLSIGVGFSADRATAEFATAINSPVLAYGATGQVLPLQDGLFRLRDSGNWAFGYNAGALIKLDPSTRIGITYRSRIQHNFSSTADFSVPYPLSLDPALANGPARTKLVLPDTADISITHVFTPRLTGYADAAWTNWSLEKSLNVYRTSGQLIAATPENYNDTVLATIGASYALTNQFTVRGGVGYDVTPTTNANRDVRVPDDNRYLLGVGASYRVTPRSTVDVAYSHVFVDSPSVNEVSTTGDALSGTYSDHVDIVSLGLRTVF
jgi:long-chain fatty acid transport protein